MDSTHTQRARDMDPSKMDAQQSPVDPMKTVRLLVGHYAAEQLTLDAGPPTEWTLSVVPAPAQDEDEKVTFPGPRDFCPLSSSAARCWLAGRRSAPASTVAAAGIGSPTSPGIPEEISCGEFSVAEVRATTRSAPPPAARLLLAGASQLCRRCSATQSSGS